jgi:two-component system cell cycle response regulator CpdR
VFFLTDARRCRRRPLCPRTESRSLLEVTPRKKIILIVDDDPSVLAVVCEVLVDVEYTLLTASTGDNGLERSREFQGPIDLLLSAFHMPGGMSGMDLATAMTIDRPQLKVLLMSGFPDGILILNEGWHFLPKPFVTSQLRALVFNLISSGRKSRFAK